MAHQSQTLTSNNNNNNSLVTYTPVQLQNTIQRIISMETEQNLLSQRLYALDRRIMSAQSKIDKALKDIRTLRQIVKHL